MSGLVLRLQRGENEVKKVHGPDIDWDPREHPRDRIGRFAHSAGGDGAPTMSPLTDAEYESRVEWLQNKLTRAFRSGKATSRTQTFEGNGYSYRPERAAQHKQIVDDLMDRYAGVPSEGKAVVSGGLGGAGKTTVLSRHSGLDMSKYAVINADDIKDEMAKRGMIPTVDGVAPLESASLIHEESRRITQMLADRLFAERKNVIWDTTMAGGSVVKNILTDLRDQGYRDVKAVFVDIPVETSVRRALERHRRGLEAWRNGQGYGDRFVPPHIIRASESTTYKGSSHNRTVFERSKKYFDSWELWDNSVDGAEPKLLSSSTGDA